MFFCIFSFHLLDVNKFIYFDLFSVIINHWMYPMFLYILRKKWFCGHCQPNAEGAKASSQSSGHLLP